MSDVSIETVRQEWQTNGYVTGLPLLSEAQAATHRDRMARAEAQIGNLHYQTKIHTVVKSACEIAVMPQVLDIVEALIGPDILLYNVTYIIKEPNAPSHVSWHQDLTYWGLSHDDQVSMWLALSPATAVSGCMRMVPGSHLHGRLEHQVTDDDSNVLLQGQTVSGVDESGAVLCPLAPGEATFHHGWTLHASTPNHSNDRRIGLNVQYLATHVRQTKHDQDTAMLVRGVDQYRHFRRDVPAGEEIDMEAFRLQAERNALHREIAGGA